MTKPPPISELEFLKVVHNHGELTSKLELLGLPGDDIRAFARHIAACWFKLAEEHLVEAKSFSASCRRSTFSRSYYAMYNASKALRYSNSGHVSMKGDDHKAASTLPHDLVDAPRWSQQITILYEHRLRADYDNWSNTPSSHTLTPAEAIELASTFLEVVREHLNKKFGTSL